MKTKFAYLAPALISLCALASISNAGGGGGNTETGTPLNITYVASIGGKTPAWSGTYTVTHSIPGYYTWDTVQVSLKGKPVNLPDSTLLNVTYFFSDELTGVALPPVSAPQMSVLKGLGSAKSTISLLNFNFSAIVRHLDGVVVTDAAGHIVVVAAGYSWSVHPAWRAIRVETHNRSGNEVSRTRFNALPDFLTNRKKRKRVKTG